VSVRS